MIRILGLIVVALGSGVLVGRFALDDDTPDGTSPDASTATFTADAPAARSAQDDVAASLDSLSGKLETESAERRRLERRLEALAGEVRKLRGALPVDYTAFGDDGNAAPVGVPSVFPGDTLSALVAAGVEESRAHEIKGRMDSLDLELMNLQYEAEQGGWVDSERFADAWRENQAQRFAVRETIGDEAYDRYLYAMGQPNRIAIQDVLEGSPAQRAGLEPGDLLLSYDGQRLFTVDELIRESRGSGAGQTVTLEVVRDGQRLQIYMPRGPLGVRSGFHRTDPEDSSG